MRRKKVLALFIGIMWILGCEATNIRETHSREAVRRETDIKDTGVRDVYRNAASKRESDMEGTILQEISMSETAMEEAEKEADIMREIQMKETDRSSTDTIETQSERAESIRKDVKQPDLYDEVGIASFISDEYDGEMTASGVRYDRNKMTAAHPSLPFGTKIVVTNLKNKRSTEVIIIDRFAPESNRILNLSRSAALELDLVESGVAKVGIKIIPDPDQGSN